MDAVDTEAPRHATGLCRQAAHEGYDGVVAFGGDGTVNEAANGLLTRRRRLPACPGLGERLLQMLGIPGDADRRHRVPARTADDWCPREVDLGVVNGRCFTFASGLGLDASVVRKVDANPPEGPLGRLLFTGSAITTFIARYLLSPHS